MSAPNWPPIVDCVQALTRNLLLTPLAPHAAGHAEVLASTRVLLTEMSDEEIAAAVREMVAVLEGTGPGITVDDVIRAEAGAR
jgi:hypothetical protein